MNQYITLSHGAAADIAPHLEFKNVLIQERVSIKVIVSLKKVICYNPNKIIFFTFRDDASLVFRIQYRNQEDFFTILDSFKTH